mgnify:CR=1 FL=1
MIKCGKKGVNIMKKENIKKCIIVLFAIYCLVLIYVLFLHNTYRYEFNAIGINDYFSEEHMQMVNIVPFKTIFGYFQRLVNHRINTDIVVRNLFVNLVLFLPMGMAIPVLCENKINKFWKFLILIILMTFIIEIIQFISMRGTADIDDVILNSIGGCIGYGIIQIKPIGKLLKIDEQ